MRYWIAVFILIPFLSLAQEHNHSEHQAESEKSFTVPQSSQQAIRVTTASVQRKDLQPQLMAQVRWQESAQRHIHSWAEDWVEEPLLMLKVIGWKKVINFTASMRQYYKSWGECHCYWCAGRRRYCHD
ncbi:hypothetical protein L8G48_05505 [Idiomarina sp. ATCH4]|nr:hypothetical protein [Idiomarina sp. ATCH4]MCK7459054.1 hypothetical protein [Idiomarina sp. ATCH4]